MNRQQIVGEGQRVVALKGINATLQKILVEFNMTFQQIVAELRLTHAVQQELAKTIVLKTTRKSYPRQPERAASLSATLRNTAARPPLGLSRGNDKGPIRGNAWTQ